MDSYLLLDIMVKQRAAEQDRLAKTTTARRMLAEESKRPVRARLASALARAAMRLDRETGRATLAGAPNH